MANEPQIIFQGFVGKVVDFQNGNSLVNVSVTPSYRDRQSQQWVDKPTMWFSVNPLSDQAKNEIDEIRNLKSNGMSVRVLVDGGLSKRVSERDGRTYENLEVAARILRIMSSKPKQQQNGYGDGFAGASRNQSPAQAPASAPNPMASDPWGGGVSDFGGGFDDDF